MIEARVAHSPLCNSYFVVIPENSFVPEAILRTLGFGDDAVGIKTRYPLLFPVTVDHRDESLMLSVPILYGDEWVGNVKYTVTVGQDVAHLLGCKS